MTPLKHFSASQRRDGVTILVTDGGTFHLSEGPAPVTYAEGYTGQAVELVPLGQQLVRNRHHLDLSPCREMFVGTLTDGRAIWVTPSEGATSRWRAYFGLPGQMRQVHVTRVRMLRDEGSMRFMSADGILKLKPQRESAAFTAFSGTQIEVDNALQKAKDAAIEKLDLPAVVAGTPFAPNLQELSAASSHSQNKSVCSAGVL